MLDQLSRRQRKSLHDSRYQGDLWSYHDGYRPDQVGFGLISLTPVTKIQTHKDGSTLKPTFKLHGSQP